MKVKVAQSCLTLWDPKDYTVHGILQTRVLEWVAFSFSRGSSQPRNRTQVSYIAGKFFPSWATREETAKQNKTKQNKIKSSVFSLNQESISQPVLTAPYMSLDANTA